MFVLNIPSVRRYPHRGSLRQNGNNAMNHYGTTAIKLSQMEFIGRMLALVPRPRVNLTRFQACSKYGGKVKIIAPDAESFFDLLTNPHLPIFLETNTMVLYEICKTTEVRSA
ncbi:MAG TPA: transposase [Pseudobdellovibrionaceae bacterium]|nr:transposase [Pseudobdellovibrionaceae bacterium]